MSEVRLAIVGSTVFAQEEALPAGREAADLMREAIDRLRPAVVISGGATGIDAIAHWVAVGVGVEIIEHLPENRRWEPDGYKARNILIAEGCTHLLCIRHHASVTYGSGWTADYAERLGRIVERHTL